ncbi:SDR family oxidoreductase [Lentzea sp. NPDC059081]|uniref:SDR family oxidoreductase n=1 Tax=Lentzea sp. NPDC059081 TaxID=3346719 RepID=UPI0036868019
MKPLEGRVALITGASRGIGFAVARELVRRGAKVCITARNADSLNRAAEDLGGPGVALAVAGRADDPVHQEEAVAKSVATFGSLDILVNSAAINPVFGQPLLEIDASVAAKILAVNVLAPLAWTRLTVAAWMGLNGGSVVNIGSTASLRATRGMGMYGISKAGLARMTMELADELGPSIRVNAVAPSVVKTRFSAVIHEGREEVIAKGAPLKRMGTPEDVAGAVAFLISEDSGWITGQTLIVDGGRAVMP